VLALQLAGRAQHPAVERGLSYLCEHQRYDGTWDEPECTGTGFPGDFYINYHLYRHLFPTMALAVAARQPRVEAGETAPKVEPEATLKEAATP
jgi:squalene-hopene/tetraprenyl-beta-curcumene cyclase